LLWVCYGLLNGDWILSAAKAPARPWTGAVLAFKVRDILSK
jgi:hypothetical protein